MGSRLFCNREKSMPAIKPVTDRRVLLICFCVAICALAMMPRAEASTDAPSWMHALAGVPLPPHDEKTYAVLLYSETDVTVLSEERIRKHVREVYKILRPEGRERGTVEVDFSP